MPHTSTTVNGRVTTAPGAYSEVDATGFSRVSPSATGIVAILGQGTGPEPGVVHDVANAAAGLALWKTGEMRQAINPCFNPSADEKIPGGAQRLRMVGVNPSTQSEVTLGNGEGDALVLTSLLYGALSTRIGVQVGNGTTRGKLYTLTYDTLTETFDDVGAVAALDLLFVPGSTGPTSMTVEVDATGVVAAFTKTSPGEDDQWVGSRSALSGMDDEVSNPITAGETVTLVSTSVADTTQTVTVYGIVNGTGLPGSEDVVLDGTTSVVGATAWAQVLGCSMDGVAVGTVTVKDTGDTDTLLTLTPGQTSRGIEVIDTILHTASGALVADGASTADVIVLGTTTGGTPQLGKVTLNGTTPVSISGTWLTFTGFVLGGVAAARAVTLSGRIIEEGAPLTAVSSNVGDTTQALTYYGTDAAGALQVESVALDGTTPVDTAGDWDLLCGFELDVATLGTITVTSGAVTVATLNGASSLYGGLTPVSNAGRSGDALGLVANGSTTRKVVVIGTGSGGSPRRALATLTGTTPLAVPAGFYSVTGLAVLAVESTRTLTLSGNDADLPVEGYPTVQTVLDFLSGLSGWTATTDRSDAAVLEIGDLDDVAATTVIGAALEVYADLYDAVAALAASALVEAEAASGGVGAPDNTSGVLYLTGGADGTALFSHWQAALDALRDTFVNTIVVLSGDAAVHAAVVAHCEYMAGVGAQERDAILGTSAPITLAAAGALTTALNSRHVGLCFQDVQLYSTEGVATWRPPYFQAVVAAGMQAGAALSRGLTHRYARVLDVRGHSSFSLPSDSDLVIAAAVLALVEVPDKGFQWLRNLTTYKVDPSNIAYTDRGANRAVIWTIYNLRQALDVMVGDPNFGGSVNSVRSAAIAFLNSAVGVALKSWRNLDLTLDGDELTADVEISPVISVNFLKVRAHLYIDNTV